MNKKLIPLIGLVLTGLFLVHCGGGPEQSPARPTRTPKPDRTERPSHYSLRLDYSKLGEYLYRGFVQVPRGMTRGPDGRIYAADWNGRHIISMGMDGSIEDLGLWKDPIRWGKSGPHFVAFDSKGILYVVSYGHILKVYPDGTTDDVIGHDAFLFGGIAINDQDQVFYAERSKGEIFTISPEGERVLVASGLDDAEGMVFGLDGTLYVAQSLLNQVVQIDIETGSVEPFFSWDSYQETIFLAVDEDGDIWIRGKGALFQVSPEGVEKPFLIGGEEYSGEIIGLATSGGIAFDESGQLWIASYSSKIMRLSDPVPGQKDSWASLETVFPGLETRTMAVDEHSNVFIPNMHTNEVWKIDPVGEVEVILELGDSEGVDSLAPGPEGFLYLGMSSGEVIRMDDNQVREHYADINATSMTFGSDGLLYAISQDKNDGSFEVVRISGVDTLEVITKEIAGYVLGAGSLGLPDNDYVKIEPAADQGLYLFDATHHVLLFLDFNGEGHFIRELEPVGHQRVAIALDGTVYHIADGDYDLYASSPDGGSETLAYDLYGDPEALSISKDGEWLFVAENGAIDMIRIR
jgi:outer membrane protein assembly factor BamB